MSYPRYPWIGNRISEEDMFLLYRLKQQTRKPITVLVSEAVSQYLSTAIKTGLSSDCPENSTDSELRHLIGTGTVNQQK